MNLDENLFRPALQVEEQQIPELKKFYTHVLEKEPGNLSALYGSHILSMRTGDIGSAISYLHRIFTDVPNHPDYIRLFIQHFESFEQLMDMVTVYIEEHPAEPFGYMMKLFALYDEGDMGNVRKILSEMYRNIKKGIHFQPYTIASLFDAALGTKNVHLAPASLPGRVNDEILEGFVITDDNFSPPAEKTAEGILSQDEQKISTLSGESIGLSRTVVNGRILGVRTPSTYFFQFGTHPDGLTNKTEIRQVPPGLFGRTKDIGSNIFRRINSMGLTLSFVESDCEQNVGSASMKIEGPFGKDRNHREGIGVIDLLLGWQSAVHLRGHAPSAYETEMFPKPAYPGEAIDMRDAKFTVTYRSNNLDAKRSYPVAWVHGGTGEAMIPEMAENYAAWAHTNDLGNFDLSTDEKWHRANFSFECNSRAWSFCGSNIEEMNVTMERICYYPIGEVLRENKSGNICICFVCGDELMPPEGDMEIGALELTYRSYSLLMPDQRVTLVESPKGSKSDPGLLTSGWIGVFENFWKSVKNPNETQEFIWQFREDALIQSVRLHQNPLWPSKNIELSISRDGDKFEEIWSGSLDDIPEDPMEWPRPGESGVAFNFAKVVVFDDSKSGRFLRLRIESGYRQEYWGLDAIEVFGNTPAFIPSAESCTVSEEITGLDTEPLFVQLIVENELGFTKGEVVEVFRPTSLVPMVSDPVEINRSKNSAEIRFRTNSMGHWGELSGEVSTEDGCIIKSSSVSIGKQEIARESVLRFEGVKPEVAYQGTAVATNENGKSKSCTFIIPTEME